jgi:hypothetical protein
MRTIIEQELLREMPVKENGRVRKMILKQAIIRQIITKSAQGDDKAIGRFIHFNKIYPTDDFPPTHGKYAKGRWIFLADEELDAFENLAQRSKPSEGG